MKKRKFLVPRQAADPAGSKANPQPAGQTERAAAAAAAAPENMLKRPKPLALQLVRPGPIAAEKPPKTLVKFASTTSKKDATKAAHVPTGPHAKEAQALLLLPKSEKTTLLQAPPSGVTAAAGAASAAAPRRPFRIPTLPPDALPSLSSLLNFDNNKNIFALLALTIEKEASLPKSASLIFTEQLGSFDSEASSQAAAEILDRILPSYYEHNGRNNKNQSGDPCSSPQGLHGVIFGLSGNHNLHTYCKVNATSKMDSVLHCALTSPVDSPFPASAIAAAVAAAAPKINANVRPKVPEAETKNFNTATRFKENASQLDREIQFSALSDSGASILSSAVWVPTPGGGGGRENCFAFCEAMVRRTLAEDEEIPLSFLKSLLF